MGVAGGERDRDRERERKRGKRERLGLRWAVETSKSTPRDTPPPTRAQLLQQDHTSLFFLNSSSTGMKHANIPMGDILI